MSDVSEQGVYAQMLGLGIALGIGFMVGLQREWAKHKSLGVRSFTLIAALGGLSGLLLDVAGAWPVAAGLVALSILLGLHAQHDSREGMTTLVAALVVFLLGAVSAAGFHVHAVVLGGVVMALLQFKKPLHQWVEWLERDDLEIIVRFVLIALVVLPVLPDRTFGPYDVFNPFTAWLFVVLIVGMNLSGYVALRFVGKGAGVWVAGALGGLISSTATTFSYATMARRSRELGAVAAVVVLVASAVVYPRIFVEISVVSPELLEPILLPGLAFAVLLLGLAAVVYLRSLRGSLPEMPETRNPARIREALYFAGVYVVVLFVVAAVRNHLGEDAIYGVALVSGLTDVDALTLSVSQLHADGQADTAVAWRAVFLASLSNLAFKTGVAAVLGPSALRYRILAAGAVALLGGAGILLLWP